MDDKTSRKRIEDIRMAAAKEKRIYKKIGDSQTEFPHERKTADAECVAYVDKCLVDKTLVSAGISSQVHKRNKAVCSTTSVAS